MNVFFFFSASFKKCMCNVHLIQICTRIQINTFYHHHYECDEYRRPIKLKAVFFFYIFIFEKLKRIFIYQLSAEKREKIWKQKKNWKPMYKPTLYTTKNCRPWLVYSTLSYLLCTMTLSLLCLCLYCLALTIEFTCTLHTD